MPSRDVMSPSIARRILSVRKAEESGKEKFYAIMKLYPSLEAHSSDHETVKGKPISKFEADEIRAMAHRFNRREAHWPLYSFFEHKQTQNTYMGQVIRMWYDEKGKWMNAEVELNSAETADFILKENLGCSLCLARTGDDKSLIEFSFVRKGNLVKSEVTSVFRNSAGNDSDTPDPHFPPNHNGVVHFIPLEAGPWIEKNTATSTAQMDNEQQQQQQQPPAQESAAESQQQQPPAQEPLAEAEVPMDDDEAAGVDDDETAYANLPPEQQMQMRRVLIERAHEAELLRRQNEQLSQQMAAVNAEREKAAREQQVAAQMELARKMMTSLKENDRDMTDSDFRVLAEEFADLANDKETELFMGLLGKQQAKLEALEKELQEARLAARNPEQTPTRSAGSSRQKEILNALQKANVHPPSLQKKSMNTQPAKRRVVGGSRLFKSLLSDCVQRSPARQGGIEAHSEKSRPLMHDMKDARLEKNSALTPEEKSEEESLIAQMVAREQRNVSRMNKRNASGQAVNTVLEANSAHGETDPDGYAQFSSDNGTNVLPFLQQRGLLGGVEGDIRNESLKRAGTAKNPDLVIEAHSAETEEFIIQSIPRRKAGEGVTDDERRAQMYEDVAAHVDEYIRSGREHVINNSMLMKDPRMFHHIMDLHLAQSDDIPTNRSMGLIDRKRFNKLSAADRQNPDYWFFNHQNFSKAEIDPNTQILVDY